MQESWREGGRWGEEGRRSGRRAWGGGGRSFHLNHGVFPLRQMFHFVTAYYKASTKLSTSSSAGGRSGSEQQGADIFQLDTVDHLAYSLDDCLQTYLFLKKLGIRDVTVMGDSAGGALAVSLANVLAQLARAGQKTSARGSSPQVSVAGRTFFISHRGPRSIFFTGLVYTVYFSHSNTYLRFVQTKTPSWATSSSSTPSSSQE